MFNKWGWILLRNSQGEKFSLAFSTSEFSDSNLGLRGVWLKSKAFEGIQAIWFSPIAKSFLHFFFLFCWIRLRHGQCHAQVKVGETNVINLNIPTAFNSLRWIQMDWTEQSFIMIEKKGKTHLKLCMCFFAGGQNASISWCMRITYYESDRPLLDDCWRCIFGWIWRLWR